VASGFNLFIDSSYGLLEWFKSQAADLAAADAALRRSMGLVQFVDYERV
jgi:hypothetical protein